MIICKQCICCNLSENQDDFRVHNLQLTVQQGYAALDFIGERVAVAGRTAFQNIANEYLLTLESGGSKDFIEQLSGSAYKRPP